MRSTHTVIEDLQLDTATAPTQAAQPSASFTGHDGRFLLQPANIQFLERFVQRDATYWQRQFRKNETYRHQMIAIWAGTKKLHEDMMAGTLTVEQIRDRSKELATMNLQAHRLVDTEGHYTEVAKHQLNKGGRAYAKTSISNNDLAQAPNGVRIAISLVLQGLRSAYPAWGAGIAGCQYFVNFGFGATQAAFSILLPLRTARDQSFGVAWQGELMPTTAAVVSSECKIDNTTVPMVDPDLLTPRLDVIETFIARIEVSEAPKSLRLKLYREVKSSIADLNLKAAEIVTQQITRLSEAKAKHADLTPEEIAVLQCLPQLHKGLDSLLSIKNTPRPLDPDVRRKLVELVDELAFWKTLAGLLKTRGKDELSMDEVLAELKKTQASLRRLVVVMGAFKDLNKQTKASEARIARTLMNALSSALSAIPNIRALALGAAATSGHLLGFGFYFDVALLASVLAQPLLYRYLLRPRVALDLEGKSALQHSLLHLTDPGQFTDADGQLDPTQLDKRMLSVGTTVRKNIEDCLKYDLQVLAQTILAYVVDPSTTDKREAKQVTMPDIVETKLDGQVTVHKGPKQYTLALTFAELFNAFKRCKSHDARQVFVDELCALLGLADGVRESMNVLLRRYRNIETSNKQLADNQLDALLGKDSLLPDASRQIIAGALSYAWFRYQMQKSGDDLAKIHFMEALPQFQSAKQKAKELARLKGRVESDSLHGLFQALQKYWTTYAGVIFGPGFMNAAKGLTVSTATVLELFGMSSSGTIVKLIGNGTSMAGSIVGGIPVAMGYQAFIKRKNDYRSDAKLDADNIINMAGTSILTQEGGFHLSLAYLQSTVQSHRLLLGHQITESQVPQSDDFPTFLLEYLSCFATADMRDAADETVHLDEQDSHAASDSEAMSGSGDVSDSDSDSDSDAVSGSGSESGEDGVPVPIPDLKYYNPYHFVPHVLSNLNVAAPSAWKAFAMARFEELARLPENGIPEWIEDQLRKLKALVDEEESRIQSTPSSSSSSDSDSHSVGDRIMSDLLSELGNMKFLSTKKLLPDERRELINEQLRNTLPDPRKPENRGKWRRHWEASRARLISGVRVYEVTENQRKAWLQAADLIQEMLQAVPKKVQKRSRTQRTSGAHGANRPPKAALPTMDLPHAVGELHRAQLWVDGDLSDEERAQRVAQALGGGVVRLTDVQASYDHWALIDEVLEQSLAAPDVKSDPAVSAKIRQSQAMVRLLLERMLAPDL